MPAQEPGQKDNDETQEKQSTQDAGRKSLSERYKNKTNNGYDVEAQATNKPVAPFPGAAYGFNTSDQPSQPPRRVSSTASLRKARSLASLQTDGHAPTNEPDSAVQNLDDHPDESIAEELAWNPSHPCFPHPNPHVPLSSPQYEQTRIIRIKRDWMAHGDLVPAYSNIYPEILDPLLPEPEFRFLLNHVNRTLLEAFNPFSTWNWVDGVLGLATGWLWEDLRPSGMKGKLRGLEFWIEQWNQRVGSRDGVKVIPLRRTGYMSLDIEIPDPQVRVVDPEEERRLEAEAAEDAMDNTRGAQTMRVGELRRGMTATTVTETDNESRI